MQHELFSSLSFLHIFISFVTLLVLGMAAFQATLLHFQNRLIRTKKSTILLKFLPPLETMETFLFQITWLGFILLTASLASATLCVNEQYTAAQSHKICLSALAWIVFAALLYGHHRAGWRGPTAVRWTLVGVVLLIVAYFSSKLIFLQMWAKY